MFLAEAGQFNQVTLLHFGRHFFLDESESPQSVLLHRKLFSHGPHSSKNSFFEIGAMNAVDITFTIESM